MSIGEMFEQINKVMSLFRCNYDFYNVQPDETKR